MNAAEAKFYDKVLRKENAKYGPVLVEMPRESWPIQGPQRKVMRSCDFLVQIFDEPNGVVRLSINRARMLRNGRWDDGISWDELMRIKAQAGYADAWAVEVFPPTEDVVNVANMRHLWVVPTAPAFAWRKGATP